MQVFILIQLLYTKGISVIFAGKRVYKISFFSRRIDKIPKEKGMNSISAEYAFDCIKKDTSLFQ